MQKLTIGAIKTLIDQLTVDDYQLLQSSMINLWTVWISGLDKEYIFNSPTYEEVVERISKWDVYKGKKTSEGTVCMGISEWEAIDNDPTWKRLVHRCIICGSDEEHRHHIDSISDQKWLELVEAKISEDAIMIKKIDKVY